MASLLGAHAQRWQPVWSQAVGPMLAAATSVMGVDRDGTLRVLAADAGTRDELQARESHIVATWNLVASDQDGPSVEKILVQVRSGVGAESPVAPASSALRPEPEQRYVAAARPLVATVEDPDLEAILTDARARWLRGRDRRLGPADDRGSNDGKVRS